MSKNSKSSVPGSPSAKQDDGSGNHEKKPTSTNTSVPSVSDADKRVTPKHNSRDKHKTDDASLRGSTKSAFGRQTDLEKRLPKPKDAAGQKSHNQKKLKDNAQSTWGHRDSSSAQTSSASDREALQSRVTSSTGKEDKPDAGKKLSSDAEEAAPQRSHNQKNKNDSTQGLYGHGKSSSAQSSSTAGEHGRQNK